MPRMTEIEKAEFQKAVCEIVEAIPKGKVMSYGQIAALTGFPGYHRMVGRTLHCVPAAAGLPCHRVVNSQGRPVPGWPEQKQLLAAEGVTFKPGGNADMKRHRWDLTELFESE